MSVSIEWQGMNECRALFQRLREQTDDLSPILNFVGNQITESTKERIADEKHAPDGSAWKALDEKYAEYKSRFSSGGLLEYSGYLLQSINYNPPTASEVVIGSSMQYAEYVQKARPFLGISNEDNRAIINHIRSVLGDN